MTEANKNSLRDVLFIIGGFGLWTLFAIYVPDDHWLKSVVGYCVCAVILACVLIFTPLGNPLKRLYRKYKMKK